MQSLRSIWRHLWCKQDHRLRDGPVDGRTDDHLDGATRERLLSRILSTISNNSLLLRGEKRTGKCALLLDLRDRLKTYDDTVHNYYPVYIDLHDVPEEQLFATVGRAVLAQLGPIPSSEPPADTRRPGKDYDHRDLARDFRRVIQALAARSPKRARLTLLVNEIDTLNGFDPRINQKVRSLFMMSMAENLVMVASAVEIDKRWEQEGSPWYNFFEEIDMTSLRPSRDRMPFDG